MANTFEMITSNKENVNLDVCRGSELMKLSTGGRLTVEIGTNRNQRLSSSVFWATSGKCRRSGGCWGWRLSLRKTFLKERSSLDYLPSQVIVLSKT